MKLLNNRNVRKGIVPNKAGIYTIYNKEGKAIYTGYSTRLKRKLQSYYHGKSQFGLPQLYFSYKVMPINKAKKIIKKKKHKFLIKRIGNLTQKVG